MCRRASESLKLMSYLLAMIDYKLLTDQSLALVQLQFYISIWLSDRICWQWMSTKPSRRFHPIITSYWHRWLATGSGWSHPAPALFTPTPDRLSIRWPLLPAHHPSSLCSGLHRICHRCCCSDHSILLYTSNRGSIFGWWGWWTRHHGRRRVLYERRGNLISTTCEYVIFGISGHFDILKLSLVDFFLIWWNMNRSIADCSLLLLIGASNNIVFGAVSLIYQFYFVVCCTSLMLFLNVDLFGAFNIFFKRPA